MALPEKFKGCLIKKKTGQKGNFDILRFSTKK